MDIAVPGAWDLAEGCNTVLYGVGKKLVLHNKVQEV